MNVVSASSSVKELKDVIARAGLTTSGCVEKSDLLVRAREAVSVLLEREKTSQNQHLSKRSMTLGKYQCETYNLNGNRVQTVIIVLHGYGATSGDLNQLAHLGYDHNCAFVFPQAPVSQGAMGVPSWWELDFQKWMMKMQSGERGLAQLIREKHPGLDQCRVQLKELVRDVFLVLNENPENSDATLVLAGFSQGAMTCMDLALVINEDHTLGVKTNHVIMLSGAPIVVEEWAKLLSKRTKENGDLKVLLAHGHSDPILPFAISKWTNELLKNHGVAVNYKAHAGGHEIGDSVVLDEIKKFINSACS